MVREVFRPNCDGKPTQRELFAGHVFLRGGQNGTGPFGCLGQHTFRPREPDTFLANSGGPGVLAAALL